MSSAAVPVHASPLAAPMNQFSLSMLQQVSRGQETENVFLSPFGITTALTILMLGARSSTEQQLRHALHFDQLDRDESHDVHRMFQHLMQNRYNQDPSLLLSSYVLVSKQNQKQGKQVLDKYKSQVHSYYGAQVDDVDFDADGEKIKEQVNQWVKKQTHGLIDKVLAEAPDPTTSLILLNAIYFKGKWRSPFDADLTVTEDFTNADGSVARADFMCKMEQRLSHRIQKIAGSDVDVVELPYVEHNISMLIFVPQERNSLKQLTESPSFASDVLAAIASMAPKSRSRSKVDLYLPKFKFETEYDMNPVLKQMGLTEIFSAKADLSGIDGRNDVHVSDVKHKAVIRVDEEGTEAAAVTSIMMRTLSFSETETVRADHPFLFTIVDRSSGIILFVGQVNRFTGA